MIIRILGACCIIVCFVVGCNRQDRPSTSSGDMRFNIDSSLVAHTIVDSSLNLSFLAPKNWSRIPDSLLAVVAERTIAQTPDRKRENGSRLFQCRYAFTDEQSGSVITVSHLTTFNMNDSGKILSDYAHYYTRQDSTADIRKDIFHAQGFTIHQLLVNGSLSVIFKMIFTRSPSSPVVEFDFVIPKNVYPQFITLIESIIGSVRSIHSSLS